MYIQNMWIGDKKYEITCVEVNQSNLDRVIQTYWGKLTPKSKEIKLATIEYHKPIFDRRDIKK